MSTPNAAQFPNLALLRQGVDYRFKIKSRALELSMRPLSIEEEDRITQEVLEELEKLPEMRRTSLKQSILLGLKKLEMGQTSDVGKNDPKMFAQEFQKMTPGELDHLFKQYVSECDKRSPMLEEMPVKEVALWVESLKKNSKDQATMLTELSFFQLVSICRFLLSEDSPMGSLPG